MKKTLVTITIATTLAWGLYLIHRPGQVNVEVRQSPDISNPVAVRHPRPESKLTSPAGAFTWSQLESTDYREYVRNLRTVGCPEATVRDIILADVHATFESQRAEIIRGSTGNGWQFGREAASWSVQLEDLAAQESAALVELLGPVVSISGAVLTSGSVSTLQLSPALAPKREALIQWSDDFQSQFDRIRAGADGRDLNEEELGQWAALKGRQSESLDALLTPAEREEFELGNSATADELRSAFAGMSVSEDEFRSLFRLRQQFVTQMETMADAEGGAIQAAQSAFKTSFQNILGQERFTQYERIQSGEMTLAMVSDADGAITP